MKRLIIVLSLVICPLLQGYAQDDYKLAGPYEVVARDGEYRKSKGGSERDMWQAWQRVQKGDTATTLYIINAYAKTLQHFDGHDAPLCTIQAYWLLRAMILSKAHQTPEWTAMVRRAILPVLDKFEADSPYANGNWGHIVNRCRMAAAIFLEDKDLYQHAIDTYLYANDNGSLPNYVSETGQCQETGRDQGHAQLGLGAMCEICEMAWEQGDDLWGALDNRLMKGIEYTAKYNLGYDVPFETWTDCTGLYNDWTEPGAMGRGNIRCIYDLPYQHYVGCKGLKMPYTKKLLDLQAKAEKHGEIKRNPEADQFRVKGVKEGAKLHSIYTYAAPEGAPLKHDYDVFIQPRGQKEWTKIDTYMAKVKGGEISYTFFNFTGDVFVRVITKNKKFKSACIRPDYRGTIANVQNDSTLQFLLFQPENVSVEFDGNITDNLLVFTSKPTISKEEAEKAAKAQGRDFRYYAPGMYTEDIIKVPSNTTVYLDGGSYFSGTFAVEDAENVSILGRGIARPQNGYEGCHVYRSKNVLIDGLIVNTCPIGESSGVTLHDVRSISHPQWGDGLNVFGGSSDILFDRVFCRNSNDCTTVYATRKGASLNAAVDALSGATSDVELQVNEDQTLTKRVTWNKAHTLTITPTKDITIKGPKNAMWLLANANGAVLNIGNENYTITLNGLSGSNEQTASVVKYESTAQVAVTNVKFQDFKLVASNTTIPALFETATSEGLFTLKNITMSNCQAAEGGALIRKMRVTNDRLVLKGYLNIDSDCPGTAIYAASETKNSGTTGRIKIDDDEFTASNTITIEWPGTKAEGIVVAIGTSTSNYGKFALTDANWVLERKAGNGDLIMALPKYSVNIDSASDGSVTPDVSEAAEGATVTLTVTPDDGYRLASLTVKIGSTTISTTAESDNTYTFTMPKGDVTVSATFEAIPASDYPVYDVTNSKGYASLNAAVDALSGATSDVELEVNEDLTLTKRVTWNKAYTLTITPTKDITIKGHSNGMWFLVNTNEATLKIGSSSHAITLDGQDNTMEYSVVQGEKKSNVNLTNVKFQNFDLNGKGHLVGSKAEDAVFTLNSLTFTNCKNPENGFINHIRVVNDQVILQGYLNIDSDCEGTAIYALAEYKSDTQVNGRIKVDDENFTASNVISINWASNNAEKNVMIEGITVVVGVNSTFADRFAVTNADWLLSLKGSDLKLAKPVVPTAKIGDTTYENLTAALAAVQDGETITLTANQEVSSRINIESKSVTIKGATSSVKISRAEKYTNGLLFLTKDETAVLTLEDVTLDDGSIETTAAMIEAGNKGMTTLKNVTVQNSNTTASGVIVNKSNGQLTLNDVKFVGCKMIVAEASNIAARRAASTDTSKGIVFVGTNNVKLVGNNTFEDCPTHIYVEKKNSLDGSEANHTTPIKIMVDSNREAGVLVKEGHADQYELVGIDGMELVQQGADVYMVTATGIRTINAGSLTGDHKIYDMRGRKLTTITEKGVYIIDGKKVVVK